MASATTEIFLGPRVSCPTTMKAAGAVAVISLGAFCTSSPYSSSLTTEDSTNRKVTLPTPRVPLGYVEYNGQRLPVIIDERSWYKWLHDLDERRLGGPTAPTVPDLSTNVVYAKEQAVAASATVANVSQQVDANAQSLQVANEVAVNAALPGASSIPPVQISSRRIEP